MSNKTWRTRCEECDITIRVQAEYPPDDFDEARDGICWCPYCGGLLDWSEGA